MKDLERLGKKIEAVSERVNNISEAIDSMDSYRGYQYNIKLEHESAIETASHDIDIAQRVKFRRGIGPKPIICKFVRRLAKENVVNRRREVERISPSILGYYSETPLAQAKIYLVLINRAGGLYGRILTEVASTDRTQ